MPTSFIEMHTYFSFGLILRDIPNSITPQTTLCLLQTPVGLLVLPCTRQCTYPPDYMILSWSVLDLLHNVNIANTCIHISITVHIFLQLQYIPCNHKISQWILLIYLDFEESEHIIHLGGFWGVFLFFFLVNLSQSAITPPPPTPTPPQSITLYILEPYLCI